MMTAAAATAAMTKKEQIDRLLQTASGTIAAPRSTSEQPGAAVLSVAAAALLRTDLRSTTAVVEPTQPFSATARAASAAAAAAAAAVPTVVVSPASPVASAAGSTAAKPRVERHRALFPYTAMHPDELTFAAGDVLEVYRKVSDGWWKARGPDRRKGLVPTNYLEATGEANVLGATLMAGTLRATTALADTTAFAPPGSLSLIPASPAAPMTAAELDASVAATRGIRSEREHLSTDGGGASAARQRRRQKGLSLVMDELPPA
jgi:hypothetical protein